MERKKVIIAIILVIMVILIGVFIFGGSQKTNKANETTNANVAKNESSINNVANEVTNEVANTVVNEIANTENTKNNIQNTETSSSTETFEEEPKTAEEKAINIVKKDWGEDNSVDVAVDGMDNNGNYIVAVRNSETTEAKAFYTVNVQNGTFEKREMN